MKCNLDNKECGDKHELLLHLVGDLTRDVTHLQEEVNDCHTFITQLKGVLAVFQWVSASAIVAITIYLIETVIV